LILLLHYFDIFITLYCHYYFLSLSLFFDIIFSIITPHYFISFSFQYWCHYFLRVSIIIHYFIIFRLLPIILITLIDISLLFSIIIS
jgi:hypothetical protein